MTRSEIRIAVFSLLCAAFITGCEARGGADIPTKPTTGGGGGGSSDTTVVIVHDGDHGEVRLEAFHVTKSQPLKFIGSWYFTGPVHTDVYARIDNYRDGGGHSNQDVQIYAVHDGDHAQVVFKRSGDECGVLPDTAFTGAVTRFVGSGDLATGGWAFYALHGSQVSCFTQTGSGEGPIDVQDAGLVWRSQ